MGRPNLQAEFGRPLRTGALARTAAARLRSGAAGARTTRAFIEAERAAAMVLEESGVEWLAGTVPDVIYLRALPPRPRPRLKRVAAAGFRRAP